jgi:hypothetical protein
MRGERTRASGSARRWLSLFIAGFAISGCDQARAYLYPKPPPTAQQIAADSNALSTQLGVLERNDAINFKNDPDSSKSFRDTADYVSAGYKLAEENCLFYFTNLRLLRNDTEFYKDLSKNIIASAGIISALATVPTAVLTGTFGATGIVPGVVDSFQKNFLFADAADSLFPLISSAMAAYRFKFPPDDSSLVNKYNASLRVRQHAALCSVPYLSYVVKLGVTQSTDTSGTPSGAPSAAPAGGAADKGTQQQIPAVTSPAQTKNPITVGPEHSRPIKINNHMVSQ